MDCYVATKRSKLRATHITAVVAENLAGLDSYVSANDVDSTAVLPGAHRTPLPNEEVQQAIVSYINGAMDCYVTSLFETVRNERNWPCY